MTSEIQTQTQEAPTGDKKAKRVREYGSDPQGVERPSVTTLLERHYGRAPFNPDIDAVRRGTEIGTITHARIAEVLTGVKHDVGEVLFPDSFQIAQACFNSFLRWFSVADVTPYVGEDGKPDEGVIYVEHKMIDEVRNIGGTLDLLAWVDGHLMLLDFKTSTAVSEIAWVQLAGYADLLHATTGARVVPHRHVVVHLQKDGSDPIIHDGSAFRLDALKVWHGCITQHEMRRQFLKTSKQAVKTKGAMQ